jgi:hypothetical protein
MSKRRRPPHLRLHVNPSTPAASFAAKVAACRAELAPVIDRLCLRYPPALVVAVLLVECEEGNLALTLRGKLKRDESEHVLRRLTAAAERLKDAVDCATDSTLRRR